MTSFTATGKPRRNLESIAIERRYRNVLTHFLSGQLPNFDHQRHVHVANILKHLPYGRELMHLGLQTMAYRHFVPDKYNAEITDYWWVDWTVPCRTRTPSTICPAVRPGARPRPRKANGTAMNMGDQRRESVSSRRR